METIKVLSWITLVLGVLSVVGWAGGSSDGYALVGGVYFIAYGWAVLNYIKKCHSK